MKAAERERINECSVRNASVINVIMQEFKGRASLAGDFESKATNKKHLLIILTKCSPDLGLNQRVWGAVWLLRGDNAVVRDPVDTTGLNRLVWR